MLVAGLNPGSGNSLYWGFAGIYEVNVVAVVGLEIVGFKGNALNSESVIFRDELLS